MLAGAGDDVLAVVRMLATACRAVAWGCDGDAVFTLSAVKTEGEDEDEVEETR